MHTLISRYLGSHRIHRLPAALLMMAMSAPAWSLRPAERHPDLVEVMGALRLTDQGQVISFDSLSLNSDKRTETIVITCRTHANGHPLGGEIVVLERKNGSLKSVWRQRNLNPWKMAIADVDGDGRREIVVGVWKKSPKDPVMAKRSFVFTWNGRRMMPKWLGSRLSRRFDDFALADINGDGWDELVSLEAAPKGRRRIAAYRWHSFGFEWLGCTPELPGLTRLDNVDGQVVATAYGHHRTVVYSRGNVVLAK